MQGLVLEPKKEASLFAGSIKRQAPPAHVRIFLDDGQTPLVEIGEEVRVGQKIAAPSGPEGVFGHASLSGKVTALDFFPHPVSDKARAIEIKSDNHDLRLQEIGLERKGWESLEAEQLVRIFQDSGLVDTDSGMKPLHVEARAGWSGSCSAVVLNACETEPYVTCDHALAMAHPLEVLKGGDLLCKAAGAERIFFVLEKNQAELADLLRSRLYFLKWKHAELAVLPSVYPQDHSVILKQEIGRRLKTSPARISVMNAAAGFAVYEAVALQKPFYERVVTVGGECIIEPRNLWVRTGTDFETLIKNAKGFLREARKILMGGPMRGVAQNTLEASSLKGTQAVLALPKELTKPEEAQPCIRCGRCVEACPVEISPVMIALAAEQDLFSLAAESGAESCIECGNCSYVCPSKRPMLEWVRHAMTSLEELKLPMKSRASEKKVFAAV